MMAPVRTNDVAKMILVGLLHFVVITGTVLCQRRECLRHGIHGFLPRVLPDLVPLFYVRGIRSTALAPRPAAGLASPAALLATLSTLSTPQVLHLVGSSSIHAALIASASVVDYTWVLTVSVLDFYDLKTIRGQVI